MGTTSSTVITAKRLHKCLWDSLAVKDKVVSDQGTVIISNVPAQVNNIVDRLFANRQRYQNISGRFPNPIRWYHVGIIHYLECSLNFNCYLGNGQPYTKKTTIVPVGRGPFSSFEEGAVDAIRLRDLDKEYDWSIGNTLYILEGFNGYGYSLYHEMNSPYLYSGSNHYDAGKYVSDGKFVATAISAQIGAALLLKEIFKRLNITD